MRLLKMRWDGEMARDKLNRKIDIGDFVCYPTMRRGSLDSAVAFVVEVGGNYLRVTIPTRRRGEVVLFTRRVYRPDRAIKTNMTAVKLAMVTTEDIEFGEELAVLIEKHNGLFT